MAYAIGQFDDADHVAHPGILARLQQAFADHRACRALHDEFAAMNDRDLADIGLNRLTIRDAARAAGCGT